MSIRWLSNSRQSMERLGFCKAVLELSGQAQTSKQMAELLRTKTEDREFACPSGNEFATWLGNRNHVHNGGGAVVTSLQRIYVYGHPSRTGWLSRHGFDEYVEYLPKKLGLVTDSYEPTDMGLVLFRGLMSPEQRGAFEQPSSVNPLILDQGEQIFFLYNLLAADGDLLLPFCDRLIHQFGSECFRYLDAGALLPDCMGSILSRFSGAIYTRQDREQFRRLEEARNRILEEIGKNVETKGSGSRREQMTISRLEWLVDTGMAQRVEPREWRLTERGLKLADLVKAYDLEATSRYPENVIPALLDSCFYGFAGRTYGHGTFRSPSSKQFLDTITPAYVQLAGAAGYCLLRPLLLYVNAQSITSGRDTVVEYDRARKLLEEIYQSDPGVLHYTIDRFNTDYQLRIMRASDGV